MRQPKPSPARSLYAGAAVLLVGLATAGVQAQTYAVPHPYAVTQDTSSPIDVRRLVLFGDSYSRLRRKPFQNWAEQIRSDTTDSVDLANISGRAVSGATAVDVVRPDGTRNSFQSQLDAWFATSPRYSHRHLTAVYFGQNDVNRYEDLAPSKAALASGVDQLIARGATAKGRRLYLPTIHDWERNPGQRNDGIDKRPRVLDWNTGAGGVTEVANARSGVVVVDLFTAFERVFANPKAYGFTNITSADPTVGADPAYLYDDTNHFGQRGQQLVAQVFRHYLTRAWDWSNTLAAGAETVQRLQQDLDAGLVLKLADEPGDAPFGLTAFAIGNAAAMAEPAEAPDRHDIARAAFAEVYHRAPEADGGVALNMALGAGANLGFAISRYDESLRSGEGHGYTSRAVASSDAVSVYLDQDRAGFEFRTLALFSRDRRQLATHDAFFDQGAHTEVDGATWSLGQTVAYPVQTGSAIWRPWAGLTHTVQRIDDLTLADPLVSDVTYAGTEVGETTGRIGLDVRLAPFAFSDRATLTLDAGVAYAHGIARDDYKAEIREAALQGYSHREAIDQPERRELSLKLGAGLDLGQHAELRAGYAVSRDPAYGTGQDLRLNLTYRF